MTIGPAAKLPLGVRTSATRRRAVLRPSTRRFGILSILVDFEFDPAKSAANLNKHGIDFVAAQALWNDPDRLEIPARSLDEPRTQVIGRIGEGVWSAFITRRGDRIRIISVRRARDEEQAAYLQD